jgi:ABC-type Fe3+-hydroxamate transport system substrate-binding protein
MPQRACTFVGTRHERIVRIVSLVPSLTETLASWGLLEQLAGRTRYCVEPAGAIDAVEVVGGTKNPDITRIREIRPDLVVVNREENRRVDFEALVAAGLHVHVTHPRGVADAANMLEELGNAVGAPDQGAELAHRCRLAHSAAQAAEHEGGPVTVFCPIWRNPWMTFRDTTYVGDMLTTAGMQNVFGGEVSGDFFEVTVEEVRRRRPSLVLLPDEPYVFAEKHAHELQMQGVDAFFVLMCGKDLAWYGPRTPVAIERLARVARRATRS